MDSSRTHVSARASARVVGLAVGAACVVGGGLVAAVTGPLGLAKGSWVAAYLVLVAGVAQVVLAAQDDLLRPGTRDERRQWVTLALWVAGNTAVVVGTLLRAPFVVDAGGVALLVALVLAWQRTRGSQARSLAWAFRAVFAVVIVSVPVGLVLAHLRA